VFALFHEDRVSRSSRRLFAHTMHARRSLLAPYCGPIDIGCASSIVECHRVRSHVRFPIRRPGARRGRRSRTGRRSDDRLAAK